MIITTPNHEAALEKLYLLVKELQDAIDIDLFIARIITQFGQVFLETEKNTDSAVNSVMWGFIEKIRELATKKSRSINAGMKRLLFGSSPA